jgi:O-antigen/teichoic acid export membrane protein
MSVLKKLASDTALYGLSSILGRLINYFLVPLYAAMLSVGTNGVITGIYSYAAFLRVFTTFGLETAYFRQAAKSPKLEQEAYRLCQRMVLALGGGTCVLLFLLSEPLGQWLNYPGGPALIRVLAFILLLDAASAIPLARLRHFRRPRVYAGMQLTNIGLNVAFNLLFLIGLPMLNMQTPLAVWFGADEQPALWVLWAQLLANLPFLWLIFFYNPTSKEIKSREAAKPEAADTLPAQPHEGNEPLQPQQPVEEPHPAEAHVLLKAPALLSYAWPIMLTGLAGMTNEMLGRIMLDKYLPEDFYPGLTRLGALGVYGNCYKLSVFMALVIQAFRMGAEPFFFAQAKEKNAPETFARVMRFFTLAGCLILLGVSLNLDWIGPLLLRRPVYWQGLHVVPILLAANLFLGIYYNLTVWFKLSDKTTWGTRIAAIGAVLTILLNFLLIPIIGYTGSAWAAFACYGLMAIICYRVGQRYFPVPYPIGFMLLTIGFCFAASMGFFYLFGPGQPWFGHWVSWPIRVVVMGVFGGVVWREVRRK